MKTMDEQWLKVTTDCHDVDGDQVSGWWPSHVATTLHMVHSCTDDRDSASAAAMLTKWGFSKWDVRSVWYITEVLPPGQVPPYVGWEDIVLGERI